MVLILWRIVCSGLRNIKVCFFTLPSLYSIYTVYIITTSNCLIIYLFFKKIMTHRDTSERHSPDPLPAAFLPYTGARNKSETGPRCTHKSMSGCDKKERAERSRRDRHLKFFTFQHLYLTKVLFHKAVPAGTWKGTALKPRLQKEITAPETNESKDTLCYSEQIKYILSTCAWHQATSSTVTHCMISTWSLEPI